jgi:hypothetical protein
LCLHFQVVITFAKRLNSNTDKGKCLEKTAVMSVANKTLSWDVVENMAVALLLVLRSASYSVLHSALSNFRLSASSYHISLISTLILSSHL